MFRYQDTQLVSLAIQSIVGTPIIDAAFVSSCESDGLARKGHQSASTALFVVVDPRQSRLGQSGEKKAVTRAESHA
jgi:hypothetical protein